MAYFDPQWWDALEKGVANLTRSVRETFEKNPENAAILRRLVQGQESAKPPSPPIASPKVEAVVAAKQVIVPPPPPAPLVERELRFGDNEPLRVRARDSADAPPLPMPPRTPEPIRGPRVVAYEEPEERAASLQSVADNCRIKARATRWQPERSQLLDRGEDVRDLDAALLAEAKQMDCWLWVVSPDKWQDRGPRAYAVVAGCYDALAAAADLMALSDEIGRDGEGCIALLAEAQSATRAMMAEESELEYDADQSWVFHWLKDQTSGRNIFLHRHMRLEDPADPANHADLLARIEAATSSLAKLSKQRKERDKLYGKISYALKKLADVKTPDGEAWPADHAQVLAINKAVAGLLEAGVPASDRKLRDLLLPAADRLPEEVGPALSRALEEVHGHLDRLASEEAEAQPGRKDDKLLAEARELTDGRHAVLIGGQPDETSRQRLERDLGLASLRWLRVTHGESFEAAAGPTLRDESVSLAMVMTRWRSHRDGPAAREVCRERGIALVEIPRGYGSRQVAHEVVRQASDRLGGLAREAVA